ncbi:MAG: Fe-S cluster assembly ATPase SufC [Candidatus Micrarchaeaceae archaeon]
MILEIKNLSVEVGGKAILNDLNLTIKEGERHVIMGPNGSGKTTLAKAIFGHPSVKVLSGDICVDGKSILGITPDKRAALGLFLGFQNPVEVDGVGFVSFLKAAKDALSNGSANTRELMQEIKSSTEKLKIGDSLIGRSLNQGFSGGEKKKAEVLQMAVLKPKIAILDEPDSGLDVDAVNVVSSNINELAKSHSMGLLIITHYGRVLSYIDVDYVHIILGGKIVAEGGKELIAKVENGGYEKILEG